MIALIIIVSVVMSLCISYPFVLLILAAYEDTATKGGN